MRRRTLPALSLVVVAALLAVGSPGAEAVLAPPDGGPIALSPVTLQPRVGSIAGTPLPGEGVYQSAVTVGGLPIVQVTWLRPGRGLDGYRTGIMWLSGTHTKLVLHPGYSDPGNLWLWPTSDYIVNSLATRTVAAFNSGFKLKDIWGGYYDNGRYAQALKPNRAAIVVYKDGHTDIGVWGVELRMTPAVQSVRQNQKILIDHGVMSPVIDVDTQVNWGVTVGRVDSTWRTGLGITAKGDLVYVAGAQLTARRLAATLLQAGAVRAIELDINADWATGVFFTPAAGGRLAPHKIAAFHKPATRYLGATDRDFYAVLYR